MMRATLPYGGWWAVGGLLATAACANAQLRFATWNISNYAGGRTADIQAAVYGSYAGRSFAPDVLVTEEILSSAALTALRTALNAAPGSPGDWASAPFVSSADTGFLYRTSKVTYQGYAIISQGGAPPEPPRSTVRYQLRLAGYTSAPATLCVYGVHMKAGTTTEDASRRLVEAQRIRANAQALNPQWSFLVTGDFNIQSAAEAAYEALALPEPNEAGRFFDPIASPAEWHDRYESRFIHTQDPIASNGGMDDRFDQILLSGRLIDGDGFDYAGDANEPYSMSTWDDPQHSYRAWGNDGTSYNAGLTVADNAMVGPSIAQALINVATSAGGHIPVFLDLRVPPKLSVTPEMIDFGRVAQGAPAERALTVSNSGDVALWSAPGIAELRYALNASAGFAAPAGTFAAAAGQAGNEHVLTMSTANIGPVSGTLVIASNAPDEPNHIVALTGAVIAALYPADLNCDGAVDFADITPFVLALSSQAAYEAQYPDCNWYNADVNGDGQVNFGDINPFVRRLNGG